MLNRQEVFNTVYTKLREQGRPTTDSAERCMYRAKYDPRTFTDYSNVEEQIDDDY